MKISLYIPTFNSAKYLEECLKSVFSQKLNFSEVIIVDNTSEDNTVEIASRFKVKIIVLKTRKGLAYARNIALKNAKYPYIASIDSDVVLDKNWSMNLMQHFKNKKIVGVGGKLVESQDSFTARWRKTHMNQNWGNKKIINPEFLFGSNCIFRKEVLKKVKGYNNKYKTNYEDVDISKKLRKKKYNLVYEPKSVCYHNKKDNVMNLVKSYYGWTFYGYPIPSKLSNFLFRFFISNPYKSIRLIIKDIINLNLINIPLDFFVGVMHSLFDFRYLIKNE